MFAESELEPKRPPGDWLSWVLLDPNNPLVFVEGFDVLPKSPVLLLVRFGGLPKSPLLEGGFDGFPNNPPVDGGFDGFPKSPPDVTFGTLPKSPVLLELPKSGAFYFLVGSWLFYEFDIVILSILK